MGGVFDMRPEQLRALGAGVNQQYGNMQSPAGVTAGAAVTPSFAESAQLAAVAKTVAANVPQYVTGFSGTMGYNAGLMMRAADSFQELDANSGANYNAIMGSLRGQIPAGAATGNGGGPVHRAPAAPPEGTSPELGQMAESRYGPHN